MSHNTSLFIVYSLPEFQLKVSYKGLFPLSVCGNAPTPDQMGPVPILPGAGALPLKSMETKYLAATLPQTPNGNRIQGFIPTERL